MLRLPDADNLIEQLWRGTPLQARLPESDQGFFGASGPTAARYDDNRVTHRFYLRRHALVRHQGKLLGGLTCDLSSNGLGFISPVQLFPVERVRLILSQSLELTCKTIRCRRSGEHCYQIGAEITAVSSNDAFQDLLRAVQRGNAAAVLCS